MADMMISAADLSDGRLPRDVQAEALAMGERRGAWGRSSRARYRKAVVDFIDRCERLADHDRYMLRVASHYTTVRYHDRLHRMHEVDRRWDEEMRRRSVRRARAILQHLNARPVGEGS